MKTMHKLIILSISFFQLTFGGLTFGQRQVRISEAVDSLLASNPQLLLSNAQLYASESVVNQVTGTLLPQLHATAGYTLYEEPNIVTPIHQQGLFPPLDDEIYEANLQLSLPIFDGGRRLTQRKVAAVSVDESQATNDLVRNEVLKQVAEIFLNTRQINDNSLLINKRLASLYLQLKDLQDLESEGRVTKGDLALVSSLIASTRSDSSALAYSRFQLSTRLATLLGTKDSIVPAISSLALDLEPLVSIYPQTEFEERAIVGPNARISEARLTKAKLSHTLASRVFWPEISGHSAYSYRAGSDWDLVGEWAIGLKVSMPLFSGGTRIAKIRESASHARAFEEANRKSELEESALLRTAYSEYKSSLDRAGYLSDAAEEKSTTLQAHVDLYEAGRIPLRDLHVQETELLQLQLELNTQKYQARLALLRYETSAGSLSKNKVLLLAGESE